MATTHKGDFFVVAALQKQEGSFNDEYNVIDCHYFIDEASAKDALDALSAIEADDIVYHVSRVASAVQ